MSLFATVPPNIAGTSGPQDLTVLQNRQITLECKSDAVPPPTIIWLKNGEVLEVQWLCYFHYSFAPFVFDTQCLRFLTLLTCPLSAVQVTVP